MVEPLNQDICAKHKEKKDFFCATDSEFFCPRCVSDHKKHDYFTDEEILKDIIPQFNSEAEIAIINQEKALIEKCKEKQLATLKILDSELEARQKTLNEMACNPIKIHPKISDIGLEKIKDKFLKQAQRDHKLLIFDKTQHFSQFLKKEVEKTAHENNHLIEGYLSSFKGEWSPISGQILHCAIGNSNLLYLLDPESGQAVKKVEFKNAKFNNQMTTVSVNGKIQAVGGNDGGSNFQKSIQEADLEKAQVISKADMKNGRYAFGISITSKELFVVGGYNGNCMRQCEAQDLHTNTWSDIPNLHEGMQNVTTLTDQRQEALFVIGGYTLTGAEKAFQSLQLSTRKQWELVNQKGDFEKLYAAIAFQRTPEEIWICGGSNSFGQIDSIYLFNNAKKEFAKQVKQNNLPEKCGFYNSPPPFYHKNRVFLIECTNLTLLVLDTETNQWTMKKQNDWCKI